MFFFGRTISFCVGRTKLMMAGTFSWGINKCFLIRFDLAYSCRWNSTSWAKIWILGFMVGNKPRGIFLGL